MKGWRKFIFARMRVALAGLFFLTCFLTTACESEKDQYSGLSDLVAERNEARKNISDDNALKGKSRKKTQSDSNSVKSGASGGNKDFSTVVLYEKNIDIVDAESRMPLAKGIAYLNKSGQIVRIKIIRSN